MMIDAVNNAMTYQAQPIVKPEVKPANAGEEIEQSMDAAPKVDATTLTVESSQGKAGSDSQGNEKDARQGASGQMKQAVSQFNKSATANTEAVFGIHEDTNRITIKIVDKQTKEVIKELPPEKTLDMIAKVWEMAGILVDEKR